ncbi:hypothetical protein Ancab_023190 [Ancistrocladus abbreviatus]
MGSLIYFVMLSITFSMLMTSYLVASQSSSVIQGSLFINASDAIAQIDEQFICATIDWGLPGGSTSLLGVDLNNSILVNAVKAFSSLKIRLGGTFQDDVIYQTTEQQPCPQTFIANASQYFFGHNPGCLSLARWDELNNFLLKTGDMATFGLNALNGRTIYSNGSAIGVWNSSNAESLIRYTASNGYNIIGWELGNELTGGASSPSVTPEQYAADVSALGDLIQEIYGGSETIPLVIAPGGVFDHDWFSIFLNQTTNPVQVITHHVYNLGSGYSANLAEKILDPQVLNGVAYNFGGLQNLLNNTGSLAIAWVGEAGGAYDGGQDLVTNAFVMSFWYLDQLGMSATYNTKAYCRQSLVGGNYNLLDADTFIPNPDYYSALLWHRLMGQRVLSTTFNGTNNIRTYAHCSKQSRGITLLFLNLDGNTTVEASVSTKCGPITISQNEQVMATTGNPYNRRFGKLNLDGLFPINNEEYVREEYHLTAQNGDLHSQIMLLNGNVLNVTSSGDIPPLDPAIVSQSNPVIVAPFSVVFVHFPTIDAVACYN